MGFREPLTRERLWEATRTGEVEHLLHWVPVKAGETYFIPAHTVHAIGAGIVLCEIQQNSDVTYRLWDYGRPREIHVEKAVPISDLGPHPGASRGVPVGEGREEVVRSQALRDGAGAAGCGRIVSAARGEVPALDLPGGERDDRHRSVSGRRGVAISGRGRPAGGCRGSAGALPADLGSALTHRNSFQSQQEPDCRARRKLTIMFYTACSSRIHPQSLPLQSGSNWKRSWRTSFSPAPGAWSDFCA